MYKNLQECLKDLENTGQLIRIKEEVDPQLEMAAIHLKTYAEQGPALLFENVKGSEYPAVSNIFGTMERSKYIFRKTWDTTKNVIALKNDPLQALKNPFKYLATGWAATKALPLKKSGLPASHKEIKISDLPLIKHWPGDGGAFITLPQVYSEDPDKQGIMNANLGMYRVQLDGNEYILNEEVGMHYQIHRGIGVHQSKTSKKGEPLKVSIFVGGPPAHTLAAVMPLPEGLSELTFAGLLAGRRFRYSYEDGYCVSHDADFVITGDIHPNETKPEGPFGDHLGYYSLIHDFPVLRVHKVYARQDAIWPFTVVGRPPQEDTSFGGLIHALTGDAIKHELPGVKEVHAVDAAGVHPLLFAIGSERYTPYTETKRPAELLTLANRILGTGQLSLAKYLFIAADEDSQLSTHAEQEFMQYVLERVDLQRDLHFQTKTTIDTLDYTGSGLNEGSKVVIAACGNKRRHLCEDIPEVFFANDFIKNPKLVMPGLIAIQIADFASYQKTKQEIEKLQVLLTTSSENNSVSDNNTNMLANCPLIIICDDSSFISEDFNNFLWVTFTRSDPAQDIYGINEQIVNKHWGCDNLVIDARMKTNYAPILVPAPK